MARNDDKAIKNFEEEWQMLSGFYNHMVNNIYNNNAFNDMQMHFQYANLYTKMLNYIRNSKTETLPISSDGKVKNLPKKINSFLNNTNYREKNDFQEKQLSKEQIKRIEDIISETDNNEVLTVSFDIRRSTTLMKECRQSEKFGKFITEIYAAIKKNIKEQGGFIGGFTGDGAIAFFWEALSEEDFVKKSLVACSKILTECNRIFEAYKSNFQLIPEQYGIGIGIDIGQVKHAEIGNELTFIGESVVNACRICSSSFDDILVNNQVKTFLKGPEYENMQKKLVDFKHEGKYLVYVISKYGN